MEAVVYEDIPDASVRLGRLKLAILAFAGVPATAPAVTALLVPVDLSLALSSSSGAPSAKLAKAATEGRLRQACADRVKLRTWLQRDLGITLDIWVAVAVVPRDNTELTLLANWQMDRHRSPLRQADAVSLSLHEAALLWGDGRGQPPMLTRFLLTHQSLLLDVTRCLGENSRQLVNPAVFSPLRAKHMAKGRTCAVAFYYAWLSSSSTTRGLARLQQQLVDIARHVLSPMQLPFSCSYGGEVEALQQNLVTVDFPFPSGTEVAGSKPSVEAALLATRSLKDICSLLGVLFGRPLVNYYAEVMAFCASVQRRRRAAGFVYPASAVAAKSTGTDTTGGVDTRPAAERRLKRGRKEETAGRDGPVDEAEGLMWCEDLGS
ncbi:uncharacterized protein Tco025E_06619 [Trypanosoma conorhini]|uniref:Uncharacterized protein n=1 Tax=Trypanosoma conorhini TaxID=83891 RepID=A0A3R7MVJ0_9TRYP|nr:uncharacterized protein Tco025E_06619 [Trypanosoma conorhini]RNF11959.1 hypothetical protein Tco025E_06619 [Trypanosoma conorhini]